ESPGLPYLRADLIRNLGTYGGFLQEVGRHEEAEATLRRAIALSERLAANFPEVPEYRVAFLAWNEYQLADLLRKNGRIPEAEAACRRALEILDAAPAAAADTLSGRMIRAGALGDQGRLRLGRHEHAEAERLLKRAIEFGRANLRLAPRNLGRL